ncbi:MAG: hypothetical protein IJH41_03495 [Eubacterium sp.]|nr:hypothetical protein [Eubacterium sp.]
MKKKLLVLMLSVIMVITMMPVSVSARTDEGTSGNGDVFARIRAQVSDPSHDPFDYTDKADRSRALKLAAEYPDKYDLRDVDGQSYVTPVKFQNPFGTCWGFAAIAAAESSILGSGLAAEDGLDASTLDLSEKHLAYFLNKAIDDPSNPQNGEGTHADDDVTVSDLLNTGGMPFNATSLFASGIGPNLESRDELFIYKGKNGWTEKRTVGNDVIDYCYDDEDDWSIPEEYRFKQSYVLRESYMLPSPAHRDEETGAYTYNEDGTAAIKDMLMNKRAVQIGFCADQSDPNQETDGIYISRNWAHYTYDDEAQANHAVTIVGWDDDYPAVNFVRGHEPKDEAGNLLNGAWLVKNSWGSEEEEFPNKGPGWGLEKRDESGELVKDEKGNVIHTGYFWLSYYDKTISMPEALAFDKSNVGTNYYIDEYDFMPVSELIGVDVPEETKMSNVFKAEECEELYKVSCETTYPNTTVVNEVYILPDGYTDPTDGKLVDRAEATFEYGGFHTIDLDTPDIIQKGQRYAIVQTQTVPGGNYAFHISMSMGEEIAKLLFGEKKWVKGVINPGESYLLTGGKWYDFADDKTKEMVAGEYAYATMTFDNFAIKGYCTPKDNLSIRVRGNKELDIDDEMTLTVLYKGDAGSSFAAPTITWELSDGGEALFEMTPVPGRQDKMTIKAKNNGTALLYVTADGIGTTAVRISTVRRTIGAIGFLERSVYTGKPLKPAPVVEDQYENVIPASHYTVKYKNNTKCGEATVYVTINEGDLLYEGEDIAWFTILPRKAVIKSLKAGKGSLTVTVKDQKASGADHYNVYYRVKGKSEWSKKTFKTSKGNKLILKNLKKGKRYQVKVCAATNKDFPGAYSKTKTSKKIK